jgi:putative ABC transport system substrate-binding protein
MRVLVLGFALSLIVASPAHGQPAGTHRIAVLGVTSKAGYAPRVDAFRAGLRDLGYVEGRNLVIEERWADNDASRLPALAAELVQWRPDVIVTSGTAVAVAKRATTTIPIVMAAAGDAVGTGLVESYARPGGNVTGSTFFSNEIGAKRVELLRESMPALRRVGVLVNSQNPGTAGLVETTRSAASSLGLDLHVHEARTADDLDAAFASIGRARDEALIVSDATVFVAIAPLICGRATAQKLPVIGSEECARGGGALAYGARFTTLWRRSASFVDRILRGARPADIPVERSAVFELIANPAAARRAGVALPPGLLARADEIVE